MITHLHYDHVGNFDLFPAATLHLQDLEMRYATGRYMGARVLPRRLRGRGRGRHGARACTRGGCASTTATREIAPGVSRAPHRRPHHGAAGRCASKTRRGWVVLASDASHFYANMEQVRPFPIVWSVADMVDGLSQAARARRLARAHHPRPRPAGARALSRAVEGAAGNRGQAGLRASPSEQLVDRVGRVVLQLVPEAAPLHSSRSISVARGTYRSKIASRRCAVFSSRIPSVTSSLVSNERSSKLVEPTAL